MSAHTSNTYTVLFASCSLLIATTLQAKKSKPLKQKTTTSQKELVKTIDVQNSAIISVEKKTKPQVVSPTKTKKETASSTAQKPTKKYRCMRRVNPKEDSKKSISHMDYEELKKRKNELILEGNKEKAIKYIDKMLDINKDINETLSLTLEFGDALFDTGKLIEAANIYQRFVTLYPGSDKTEYASYKSVLASFYQVFDADRDQTKTKETIEITKNFLDRADVFTTHSKDVKDVQNKCYERLFASDLDVFDFYLNQGRYKEAERRLVAIREELLPLLSDLEPRILYQECRLAERQKNKQLAEEKRIELNEKFPTYIASITSTNWQKRKFAHRF